MEKVNRNKINIINKLWSTRLLIYLHYFKDIIWYNNITKIANLLNLLKCKR